MTKGLIRSCILAALSANAVHALQSEAEPTETPSVLVVAAQVQDLEEDHYQWAAEMAAARLAENAAVLEGGLAAALRYSREHPGTVDGIIEVVIDVHTLFEVVRINCYDSDGRLRWKTKAKFNMGGSEEKLARNMLDRALKKAENRPACGG